MNEKLNPVPRPYAVGGESTVNGYVSPIINGEVAIGPNAYGTQSLEKENGPKILSAEELLSKIIEASKNEDPAQIPTYTRTQIGLVISIAQMAGDGRMDEIDINWVSRKIVEIGRGQSGILLTTAITPSELFGRLLPIYQEAVLNGGLIIDTSGHILSPQK